MQIGLANAADDPEIELQPGHIIRGLEPNEVIQDDEVPGYATATETYYDEIDDNLEKKIEEIIQQKLSDLLLSHACPVCKKALEEKE